MISTRRSGYEIMGHILELAEEGEITKTKILYQANLNYGVLQKYLAFLLNKGLLEERSSGYRTTKKGLEFLKVSRKLSLFLEGGLDKPLKQIMPVTKKKRKKSKPEDIKEEFWNSLLKALPSEAKVDFPGEEEYIQEDSALTHEWENLLTKIKKREKELRDLKKNLRKIENTLTKTQMQDLWIEVLRDEKLKLLQQASVEKSLQPDT